MKGKYCPLLKKDCIEHKCSWYTYVRGFNPNTGQEIDEWSCTVNFIPMLLIENSQQQRSTGAAVESFRNEMVKANESNLNILEAAANMFYSASDTLEQVRIAEDQQRFLPNQHPNNQLGGE